MRHHPRKMPRPSHGLLCMGSASGHGTHCASTAAGTTWGVAKKAHIVTVQVLSCQGWGSFSGIMEGVLCYISMRVHIRMTSRDMSRYTRMAEDTLVQAADEG